MAYTDVVLRQRNNQFTVVSGATAGTHLLADNNITIAISGTDYRFNPRSSTPNGDGNSYLKYKDPTKSYLITVAVDTA